MLLHRFKGRAAQVADLRLGPREEDAVGLRPAAHRLVERLTDRGVQRAQSVCQGGQRPDLGREVIDSDEPRLGLKPLPPVIAEQTPSGGEIGPEEIRGGRG